MYTSMKSQLHYFALEQKLITIIGLLEPEGGGLFCLRAFVVLMNTLYSLTELKQTLTQKMRSLCTLTVLLMI